MIAITKLLLRLTKADKKISKIIDLTEQFNNNHSVYQDVNGWDVAVIQTIGLTNGSIFFSTTNDDGSITGEVLPVPEVPINWFDLVGVDISDNSNIGTISSFSGFKMVKFNKFGKYIKFATTYSVLPCIGTVSLDIEEICTFPIIDSLYYQSEILDLEIGIFVYSDPELLYPVSTNSYWTKILWGGNATPYNLIQISSFGEVLALDTCPVTTTTTAP